MTTRGPDRLLLGPRAVDFVSWASQPSPPTAAVVGEGGAAADALGEAGIDVHVLEDRHRRSWDSSAMDLLVPTARSVLTGVRPAVVLPYAHTAGVATLAAAAEVAGPRRDLVALLDDKGATRDLLSQRGVPVPATAPADAGFPSAARQLGLPLVLQERHGSSGRATWVVHDAADWAAALGSRSPAAMLASSWAGDTVVNTHLGVGRTATGVAPLSVQLAGLPGTGTLWPVYSGNDFAAARTLPRAVQSSVRSLAGEVAAVLREIGYRGVAGVDVAVDDGGLATVLEVNPRLQGSTWLLGEALRAGGHRDPLPDWFLGDVPPSDPVGRTAVAVGGGQLLIRIEGTPPAWPAELGDGRYAVVDGELRWTGPGIGLTGCGAGEVVLAGTPSRTVSSFSPGSVLVRVASPDQLVTPDGRGLTAKGARLVELLTTPGMTVRSGRAGAP